MTPDQSKLVEAFLPVAEEWEATIRTMYLDTEGYVTAGDGFLLSTVADAQRLPFKTFDRVSTPEEIAAEYSRVKGLPKGLRATAYSRPNSPSLAFADIRKHLREIVEGIVAELYNRVLTFAGLPFEWRLALLDMAYNMGVHRLLSGWPHLWQAIEARNEGVCAKECVRPQVDSDRNTWTQRQFLLGITGNQAMQNAFSSRN